jgi:hypothetical protein
MMNVLAEHDDERMAGRPSWCDRMVATGTLRTVRRAGG